MIFPRTTRRVTALGAGVCLLAACSSGGSSTSKVATLDTSGAGNADSATTTTVDTQDALLAYAQCMRDNGVDMQDPTVDADGNVQGGFGPDSGIDPRSTEFQTAQDACGDLIQGVAFGGGPGGGRFDQTAIQDGLNSYTQCLRDQGLDVDDISLPEPGQGRPPDGGTAPAGASDGATAGTGGPFSTDGGAGGGGFDGGPPGSPPDGAGPGGPGGGDFDPTARIVEQLGLDDSDPATASALEACSSVLTDAFDSAVNSTDTTEAG